jgi:uncharacterized protein YjbI with pentapeptide repeats
VRRRPFKLGPHELFGEAPPWQQRLQGAWRAFFKTNFPAAIGHFFVCIAIAAAWKLEAPQVLPDLWPAMGGMAFEVFFILIVFAVFEQRRVGLEEIERQREVIDDLKTWDSPEARQRIAGAIRRLNKRGIFSIDLRGATISDFAFSKNRIDRISGSVFYDGSWGQPANNTRVELTRISFDWVDCSSVQYSPFDPFESLSLGLPRYANLDGTFLNASLREAMFNGASLAWSTVPPKDRLEAQEETDGTVSFVPLSFGPFDGADLSDVSFRGCVFRNADFRGAENVETVDFFRAEELEEAFFDTPDDKSRALASANRLEGA